MSAIENNGRAASAQNHPSENSRRPGNPGHPGKHLGQFKAAGLKPDHASQPLIQQQLTSLQNGPKDSTDDPQVVENPRSKGGSQQKGAQQQVASATNILADHNNDMSDAFAEQISFTSKMHAISTGLL